MTLSCSCTALLTGGSTSGFEPDVPWPIQLPPLQQLPDWLQSQPGSTVPCQSISSKGSGRGNICFLRWVCSSLLSWTPLREWEKGKATWGKMHTSQASGSLFPHQHKVTLAPCSSWLSGCKEPASTTTTTTPPWWLYQWGRAAPATVWARAAVVAEFRAQGTAAEHLSDPNTATSSAGLDGREAGGRLQWPSPAKMAAPRDTPWQKSRFLKRFWEGAYKRGNLSP